MNNNDDPMASEDDPTMFPDDEELEDDTNSSSSTLNAIVPDPDSTSDDSDTDPPLPLNHHNTTVVTVAVPSSVSTPPAPISSHPVTVALPHRIDAPPSTVTVTPEKKPIDDSRRLFQRLWTDEDEIELLQGFLDYTTSRGTTSSGHHHDTAAFYDQIKSKLQLDFNKNQLVEKLRRLKKKYRNVLSKMASGKEFVFKSPHDQATFELSKKIWSNLSGSFRGGVGSGGGGGGGVVSGGGMSGAIVEFDEEEPPNPNYNAVTVAAATPPRPMNSSYVISHINLNSSGGGGGGGGYEMMMTNTTGIGGGLPKLSTRKRPRASGGNVKTEGVNVNVNDNLMNNNVVMNNDVNLTTPINSGSGGGNYVSNNNVSVSSPLQGLVEETVRNCLSPVLKELINTAVNGAAATSSPTGTDGGGGFKGVSALALNAMPLNFSAANAVGKSLDGMDEKWRKQQIMELEVYSKRLELVQDQIKLSLEELRSMES